jgi:hypothetical protein
LEEAEKAGLTVPTSAVPVAEPAAAAAAAAADDSDLGAQVSDPLGNILQTFVEFVSSAEVISDHLRGLVREAHFRYSVGDGPVWSFRLSEGRPSLLRQEKELQLELSRWAEQVEQQRQACPHLLFYTNRQLLQIHTALQQPKGPFDLWSYLRVLVPSLTLEDTAALYDDWAATGADVQGDLERVMDLIRRCVASTPGPSPGPCKDPELEPSRAPVVLHMCATEQEVLRSLVTFFARQQHVPQLSDVLCCTPETTAQQVALFVRLWAAAGALGRADQPMVLANVQLLPYDVQVTLAELVRTTAPSNAQLVLMSTPQAHVVSSLQEFRGELLSQPVAPESYERLFRSRCIDIQVVSSPVAGVGKTHAILKHAASTEPRVPQRHYVRLSVQGHHTSTTLVDLLLRCVPSEASARLVLHIDIAHNCDAALDALLFQLIVCGALTAADGRVFYLPRAEIMIEVANTRERGTSVTACMSCCSMMPRLRIPGLEARTEIDLVYFQIVPARSLPQRSGPCVYRVQSQHNTQLQLVCKYLVALETGVLAATPGWRTGEAELAGNVCWQALLRVFQKSFGSTAADLSMALVTNLVKYLHVELEYVEKSDFFCSAAIAGERYAEFVQSMWDFRCPDSRDPLERHSTLRTL